jgi:hypothetical protein
MIAAKEAKAQLSLSVKKSSIDGSDNRRLILLQTVALAVVIRRHQRFQHARRYILVQTFTHNKISVSLRLVFLTYVFLFILSIELEYGISLQ